MPYMAFVKTPALKLSILPNANCGGHASKISTGGQMPIYPLPQKSCPLASLSEIDRSRFTALLEKFSEKNISI